MLKNKTVFVTGAYGHLGKSISKICLKNNANLILQGRDLNKLNLLKETLEKNFKKKIDIANFDLNDHDSVEYYFNNFKKKLDVLINNAHSTKMGSFENISNSDFLDALNNNVVSAYNLIKITKKFLIRNSKKDSSSIINVSSIYSLVSPDLSIYSKTNENSISYGSSKSALNQITKYFAVGYAKYNIRVNNLILGPFPNNNYTRLYKNTSKKILSNIPLNRFGNEKDLEGPIVYLSSRYSSYVTGSNLLVDGGWTIK